MRITLIDKRNFNLFQPLLYQVSTACSAVTSPPHRELVGKQRNVRAGETNVDPEGQIIFNGKAQLRPPGAGHRLRQHLLRHHEWHLHATNEDPEHAEEIRRRLLMAMEQAEQTPDPDARRFCRPRIAGVGPVRLRNGRCGFRTDALALKNAFKQLDLKKTIV